MSIGPLTAILFPGQVSQTAGMRDIVERERPDLLALVIDAVGEDPFSRAGEGTHFAQPAIFAASLAGWHRLGRPSGDFMAGHSLRELAALVAAGGLSEADGVRLVVLRGRLMDSSKREELDVTGAFHSPMMASAVPEFRAALAATEFAQPAVTVLSAVTAEAFTDPARQLADALTMPVRWRETMLALHARGAERFVEVGPGRLLTGLAKRTLKGVELVHA